MASNEERNALKCAMHKDDKLEGIRGGSRDRIPR